jgi:hypothetical protein
MIGDQQARDLAGSFVDAQKNRDVDALLSLCSEDVLYSGLWGPKKLVGSPTGFLRGKDQLREFLTRALKEWSEIALNTVGAGERSVVIHAKLSGIIGVFYVLILDEEGKIAQIGVHQEVV